MLSLQFESWSKMPRGRMAYAAKRSQWWAVVTSHSFVLGKSR